MRNKKILGITLAVLFITFSFLTGCGSNEKKNTGNNSAKNTTAESTSKDDSKKNDDSKGLSMDEVQEYTFVRTSPIQTLDPQRSGSTPNWAVQSPIYEGLTRYIATPDGGAEIVEGVAKSWTISEDGLTYTFNLRDNAKWSDGTPVTAKDFEYSFKRVFDPAVASDYSWMLEGIIKNGSEYLNDKASRDDVGVKALDEYTLEFVLERPCGYFLTLTAFPTYKPVKQEAVEKWGEEYGSSGDKVLGNGPFMLNVWEQNVKIEYVPNPYYWDKENVHLTKITRKVIQETAAAAQSLLNGEVDSAGINEPEWKSLLKDDGRFNHIDGAGADNEFLMFNTKNKYLKNNKIRKAISIAIDREAYNEDVCNGNYFPSYSMVAPVTSIGNEVYTKKVNEKNQHVKTMIEANKDPKALLIQGLKEEGFDTDPSNVIITLNTRGTSEFSKKSAEWLQQKFRETLGIELNIEMTEWNIMWDKVDAGEYEIAVGGWSADYNDPSTFLDCFHTKKGYYGEKKTGWTGEQAEKFNQLIDKAQMSTDNDERAQLFLEAEKVLLEEAVVTPLYSGKFSTFVGKYVKNYNSNPFVYGDFKGRYIQGR
ncbi:peptide ABC transporter substrate-binding protein [Oceanirhabdus seepicola]|uniref:Peptide ABC transporter substrate-binding protein n=1 Tax=Oceanirhabdus seepicola TaxID=2828781 RepID=A0A9J6PAN1_9CLOT|nr:peptide ABC transporter substrate-binding protein [Oceanirhabdus seepicola]MCM1992814.1 peptide ABC transporter substrate-binding protein [Oceanirhabdus seepicola]